MCKLNLIIAQFFCAIRIADDVSDPHGTARIGHSFFCTKPSAQVFLDLPSSAYVIHWEFEVLVNMAAYPRICTCNHMHVRRNPIKITALESNALITRIHKGKVILLNILITDVARRFVWNRIDN